MADREARAAGDDWLERVRAASDIVEIVGQHVALKRVGRSWTGLCPFHPDKSPSLSVNADRQFYHCFACGAGGDVFKFVQEFEKVGFAEALEALSRRAGIPVPARRERGAGVRGPLLEALEAAADAYQRWLKDPQAGRAAREHLEGRGVDPQTAQAFRLGYAPPGWENLSQRLRGRIPEATLMQAGLVVAREGGTGSYDRFRDRLMVPLVEPGGRVVGFGARALGDETPKYLNSPETAVYRKGGFLFALDRARRSGAADQELVLVEGYFDAIALHRAGVDNAVATSGTALTADQARLLRRRTPRVALTYDGDQAGREAMMRSLGVLLGEGLEVRVVDLPPGEDPDTLVRRDGAAAWREARDRAYDPVEFIQRHAVRGAAGSDPREQAAQAVVRLAAAVGDPLRARLLLERAEQAFGIEAAVLERAMRLRRAGESAGPPIAAAVRVRRTVEESAEWMVLVALLRAPECRAALMSRLGPADFGDPEARAVAEALWEGRAAPDSARLRAQLAEPGEAYDWPRAAEEFARKLRRRRLQGELRSRRQRLAGGVGEEEVGRLEREIQSIAEEIRSLQ